MSRGVADGGVLVVADGNTARLVSLLPYTNYSLVVAAATGAGVGVPSPLVSCTTREAGNM